MNSKRSKNMSAFCMFRNTLWRLNLYNTVVDDFDMYKEIDFVDKLLIKEVRSEIPTN